MESYGSKAGDEETKIVDTEVEAGYEWFGTAKIQEIVEDAIGTDISDENGGQSEWSLEECQELLGEVIAERTRLNESVEDVREP